ncbi:MAG: hypothetical protein ACXABY_32580 [Candidatus Thorarchaeota archaeon]|jgi:hypothetical protein
MDADLYRLEKELNTAREKINILIETLRTVADCLGDSGWIVDNVLNKLDEIEE